MLGVGIVGACATGSTSDIDEDDTNGSSITTSVGGSGGTGTTTTTATDAMSATSTVDAASTSAETTSASTSSSTSTSVSSSSSSNASSSSTGGCTPTNILADSGLEAGPYGGSWTETSTNFGTPVCDVASCGYGGGTGPFAGTYWAWFGGVDWFALYLPETVTLAQTVTIPVGTATLEFRFELPVCDSNQDTFVIKIDNTTVFSKNGGDTLCGQIGYGTQTVNLNAYANGGVHTLLFESVHQAYNLGPTNFMVDNIQLIACL